VDSYQNILTLLILYKDVRIKIYKTIVLPVVLYGCLLSLTLRKEHILMLFKNRFLRGIFTFKGEEVTRGWRYLS
jgi:hypothetical protein